MPLSSSSSKSQNSRTCSPYFFANFLIQLEFFFSDLFPVSPYFFVVSVEDGSKTWRPRGVTVLDIPTAWAFFGKDSEGTLRAVGSAVRDFVAEWNESNAKKQTVR